MAQQADGTVYIDTLLDTTGFKAGGKDVEAAVRRMSKTVSGIGTTAKIALQKQTNAFVKANQAYAQQEQKVEALKNKLKEMSEQKVATDEFKEIGKQIDSETAKLNRLEKAQEEFLSIGGKKNSSVYKRREIDIEELRNSIKYAKAEQNELLNKGEAYKAVDTSGVENKLFNEEQRLHNMNNSLATSYASLKSKVDSYSGSAINLTTIKKRLDKAFSSFVSTVRKVAKSVGGALVSGLKKAGTAMFNLHKSTKKSDRSIGSSIKTMLKYGLGIRSVFLLVNKLRSALVDGFKNLVQYDNRTNASVSSLMSALTQLKNSFATAFAPILNVVAPILKTFINMISRAVTYVGMLIAALTGQNSFVRATEVQEDYAASLGDTASGYKKAEKAQNKYLSGLDEIRRWENPNDNNSDNGGGGGYTAPTPGEMFETVPIENSLKNLAEKIKEMWENADFSELGYAIGGKIKNALDKIPWDTIRPTAEKVGKSIATFLNGGIEVPGFAESIGKSVGQLINTGLSLAKGFINNLHFNSVGRFIADGMNGAIGTISWAGIGSTIRNGLNGVFEAAKTWSGRFDFKQLGNSIKTLINSALTAINWENAITAAGNIGRGIAESLNAVINPQTFGKIGSTLAKTVKTVIKSVKEWTTKSDFYTWGESLGTALNNFFDGIDWEEVGLTLDGLIGGLVEFMKGFVETGKFETFAEKIGTALSGVKWAEHLRNAAEIIVNAIKDLLVGMAKTPAGKFIEAFGLALLAVKLTASIYKFVNGIAAIFGHDRNSRLIKGAIDRLLEKAMPTGEVMEQAGKAAGKAAGGFSMLRTVLGGATEAGLIAALVVGAQKMSEFTDAANGGNGILTDLGFASDELGKKLQMSGAITSEQRQELFLMKEELENAKAGTEEFASSFIQKLSEAGVSNEQFKTAVLELGLQFDSTEEQAEFFNLVLEGLGTASETMAGKFIAAGQDGDAAFKVIRDAIFNTLAETGSLDDTTNKLLQTFEQTYKTTGSVDAAFQAFSNVLADNYYMVEDADGNLENLSDRLNKDVISALQDAGIEMGNFETSAQNLKTKTDDLSTGLSDGMVKEFGNIKDSAEKAAESTGAVETSAANAKEDIGDAATKSQEFATNLGSVGDEGTTANTAVDDFHTAVQTLTDAMPGYSETLSESGTGLGENLISGLSSGITDNASDVTDAAQGVADGVPGVFAETWDIHSPSKVAQGQSEDYMSGLSNGFTGKKEDLVTKVREIVTAIKEIFPKHNASFTSFGTEYMNKFKDGIANEGEPITTAISTLITNVKSIFAKFNEDFYDKGLAYGEQVESGLASSAPDLSDAAERVAGSVRKVFSSLSDSMYSFGYSVGKSFADGLSSVYIKTPHMYISDWIAHSVGNGGNIYTPKFSVQWYKSGGLFNQASVIGVGEDGAEAVLPIESRPVMTKLANSIVSGLSAATLHKVPIMATGSVVPPQAAKSNDSVGLHHAVASLNNVLDKLNIPQRQSMQNGGTYEFIAQLNRRTIFDEIVTEAKLRQSKTGRNPFELA